MKAGRNDLCPCRSGKKYKKCCLAKDERAAATPTAPHSFSSSSNVRTTAAAVARPSPVPRASRESAAASPPTDAARGAGRRLLHAIEGPDAAGRAAIFLEAVRDDELMEL